MNYEPALRFYPAASRLNGWGTLIRRLFHDYPSSFAIRLWDDETIFVGRSMPYFTLVFHSPALFRDTILRRDTSKLTHAYFSGDLDVEGDVYRALELRHFLAAQPISIGDQAMLMLKAIMLTVTARHPKQESASRKPQSVLAA
ncbi:MAG: hypothetical protein ABI905_05840 [Betaproteobacteria bacterium]